MATASSAWEGGREEGGGSHWVVGGRGGGGVGVGVVGWAWGWRPFVCEPTQTCLKNHVFSATLTPPFPDPLH